MDMKQTALLNFGMSQDKTISKEDNKYAYENRNIKILASEDGKSYSITNINGSDRKYTIRGTILATCLTPEYLVVFAKSQGVEGNDYIYRISLDDIDTRSAVKILYVGTGELNFGLNHTYETLYYEENANIKKVYWCESWDDDKVDNNNLRFINIITEGERSGGTRFTPYTKNEFEFYPSIGKPMYVKFKKVWDQDTDFPAGVVQYFFTYYNENGAETKICQDSPLLTLTFNDRGAKVEEKPGCSIKMTIKNYDTSFDYIRIYSAVRSTLDGELSVHIVGDLAIPEDGRTLTFQDVHKNQETIQSVQIYFIGGTPLAAKTITQKDNTLFAGNIKTSQITIPASIQKYFDKEDAIAHPVNYETKDTNYTENFLEWDDSAFTYWSKIVKFTRYNQEYKLSDIIDHPKDNTHSLLWWDETYYYYQHFIRKDDGTISKKTYYNTIFSPASDTTVVDDLADDAVYAPTTGRVIRLRNANLAHTFYKKSDYSLNGDNLYPYVLSTKDSNLRYVGFKHGEIYRFGLQFQDTKGQWTEVLYIGDAECRCTPAVDTVTKSFYYTNAVVKLPDVVKQECKKAGFINYRLVYADPEMHNGRKIVAQGILNPTVFSPNDRYSGTSWVSPSWSFRPVNGDLPYHHFQRMASYWERTAEIANIKGTESVTRYALDVEEEIKKLNEEVTEAEAATADFANTKRITMLAILPTNSKKVVSYIITCRVSDKCWKSSFTDDLGSITNCWGMKIESKGFGNAITDFSNAFGSFEDYRTPVSNFDYFVERLNSDATTATTYLSSGNENAWKKLEEAKDQDKRVMLMALARPAFKLDDPVHDYSIYGTLAKSTTKNEQGETVTNGVEIRDLYSYYYLVETGLARLGGNIFPSKQTDLAKNEWNTVYIRAGGNYAYGMFTYLQTSTTTNRAQLLAKNKWICPPIDGDNFNALFTKDYSTECYDAGVFPYTSQLATDGENLRPQFQSLKPLFDKAKDLKKWKEVVDEGNDPRDAGEIDEEYKLNYDTTYNPHGLLLHISAERLQSSNDTPTSSTEQQKILMNNDAYFVDNSIVTFNSPDFDALSQTANSNLSLDIVGAAYINHNYAKREVELENPPSWDQMTSAEVFNDYKYTTQLDSKDVATMATEYCLADHYIKEMIGTTGTDKDWSASKLLPSTDTTLVADWSHVGYFLTHTWENNTSICGIAKDNSDISAKYKDGNYTKYNTTEHPIESDYATILKNSTYNYKIAEQTVYTVGSPTNKFTTGPISIVYNADTATALDTKYFGATQYDPHVQKNFLGKSDIYYLCTNSKDEYILSDPAKDQENIDGSTYSPTYSSSTTRFGKKPDFSLTTIEKIVDGTTLAVDTMSNNEKVAALVDYSANRNNIITDVTTDDSTTQTTDFQVLSSTEKNYPCMVSYYSTPHAVFSLGHTGNYLNLLPYVYSQDSFSNDILYMGDCNRTFFDKSLTGSSIKYPWAKNFDFKNNLEIESGECSYYSIGPNYSITLDSDAIITYSDIDTLFNLTEVGDTATPKLGFFTLIKADEDTWKIKFTNKALKRLNEFAEVLYKKYETTYTPIKQSATYGEKEETISVDVMDVGEYCTIAYISEITIRHKFNEIKVKDTSSNTTGGKETDTSTDITSSTDTSTGSVTELTKDDTSTGTSTGSGIADAILDENTSIKTITVNYAEISYTIKTVTCKVGCLLKYNDGENDWYYFTDNSNRDYYSISFKWNGESYYDIDFIEFLSIHKPKNTLYFKDGNEIYSTIPEKTVTTTFNYKGSFKNVSLLALLTNATEEAQNVNIIQNWNTDKTDDNDDRVVVLYEIIANGINGYPTRNEYQNFVFNSVRTKVDISTPKYRAQKLNDGLCSDAPTLYIGELKRNLSGYELYGGTSDTALENLTWLPASNYTAIDDVIYQSVGDTYFQRYDCLKTYPCDDTNINKVTEIASVMIETHKNLDARSDVNRWNFNTQARPDNFGLYNTVYDQKNNIFTGTLLPELLNQTAYKNTYVWSGTKNFAGRVDSWSNLSTNSSALTHTEIAKLLNHDNKIYAFEFNDVEQVSFNEKQFVPTESNSFITTEFNNNVVTIPLTNRYGTHNHNVLSTHAGIYFVDDNKNTIMCVTDKKGFVELPYTKMEKYFRNHISIEELNRDLNSEVSIPIYFGYDDLHKDVYIFFPKYKECVVYNELLDGFVSFIDLPEDSLDINLFTYHGHIYSLIGYEYLGDTHDGIAMHEMYVGNPNSFLDDIEALPQITYRVNPNITFDKVFTNLEMQVDSSVSSENNTKCNCFPFGSIRLWTEYQDTGDVQLIYKPYGVSNLQAKFRTWRITLPRDKTHLRDRIRNPWVTFTLKGNRCFDKNFEIHNVVMDHLA